MLLCGLGGKVVLLQCGISAVLAVHWFGSMQCCDSASHVKNVFNSLIPGLAQKCTFKSSSAEGAFSLSLVTNEMDCMRVLWSNLSLEQFDGVNHE